MQRGVLTRLTSDVSVCWHLKNNILFFIINKILEKEFLELCP